MMWPEQLGAKCSECPLNQQTPVRAEVQVIDPQIYIIGDAPGRVDVVKARPFSGETGRLLNALIDWLPLDRAQLHLSNATACQPLPHMSTKDINLSYKCCSPRLETELSKIKEGALIITLGSKPLHALTGKSSVKDWRGYPLAAFGKFEFLNERKVTIFPTFHPLFVIREPRMLPVIKLDIRRAIDMHRHPIEWKAPPIEIQEGVKMWNQLERMAQADWVGVDVETGGIDPYTAPLLCIGIADTEGAVSLRWPPRDPSFAESVRDILFRPAPRKVFQNGQFDCSSFKAWGIDCSGNDFDTLIAHRIVAPQLPHDLGFIFSLEFAAPRWKSIHKVGDDRKGAVRWREAAAEENSFDALRTYNALDAWACAMLRPALERRMLA